MNGKYVRDAEFPGEHPYYYIDIHTGHNFLPKHIFLRLQRILASKKDKLYYTQCLYNQWGKQENTTNTIRSIIDDDILGKIEDEFTIDASYSRIDVAVDDDEQDDTHINGTHLELYDKIVKDGFVDCFVKMLNEFKKKPQYAKGVTLHIEDYKIPRNTFFTSTMWNSYVTCFFILI